MNRLHNTTNYEKYRLELNEINQKILSASKYSIIIGFFMFLAVLYHITNLTYLAIPMIILACFIHEKSFIADIISIPYYCVVWIVMFSYHNFLVTIIYTILCSLGMLKNIMLIPRFIRLNQLKKEDGYPLFDVNAIHKDAYIYNNYTAPEFRNSNMESLECDNKEHSKVDINKKEKIIMQDVYIQDTNKKSE